MKVIISFLVVVLAVCMVTASPTETRQDDSDSDVVIQDSEPTLSRERRAAGCSVDTDCSYDQRCDRMKCRDACTPKTCGMNADCTVTKHKYNCTCRKNYKGDPFKECIKNGSSTNTQSPATPAPTNPIDSTNILAETDLPEIKPKECYSDSACPNEMACIEKKCVNPCTFRTCGPHADCDVKNHRTVCSCWENYTGDPNRRCDKSDGDGASNSFIQESGWTTSSSFIESEKFGREDLVELAEEDLPEIKPEACYSDSACPNEMACMETKCVNPCTFRTCGPHADCDVKDHRTVCSCWENYTGDPNQGCSKSDGDGTSNSFIQESGWTGPSPFITNENYGAEDLVDLEEEEDLTEIKPEACYSDSACPNELACMETKCVNPCTFRTCGPHADCDVKNHRTVCSCWENYTGDPNRGCDKSDGNGASNSFIQESGWTTASSFIEIEKYGTDDLFELPEQSEMKPEGNQACENDSACSTDMACMKKKCVNPCTLKTCGAYSYCDVKNHRPVCSCWKNYKGDPYKACYKS